MTISQYRKKPVIVKAEQFKGWASFVRIAHWVNRDSGPYSVYYVGEGFHHASRKSSEMDRSSSSVLGDAPAFMVLIEGDTDYRANLLDWVVMDAFGVVTLVNDVNMQAQYEKLVN